MTVRHNILNRKPCMTDLPVLILPLPNLHVFIIRDTTHLQPKNHGAGTFLQVLNFILSKSNCAGRDNIFPFLFFFSQCRNGSKETREGKQNKKEELERKRA